MLGKCCITELNPRSVTELLKSRAYGVIFRSLEALSWEKIDVVLF